MPQTWQELDSWRARAFADWTDARVVTRDQIDIWVWFFEHLYADLANFGWSLARFSFSQRDPDWLMVVSLETPEGRQVVFVSSSTPTRCMRKFRSLLRRGDLKMYPDKYA